MTILTEKLEHAIMYCIYNYHFFLVLLVVNYTLWFLCMCTVHVIML